MKIRGTEGLTPADIQAEIARGARFVAYQWCLSLFLITFRRASGIHYLKPGQSGFGPGFLWSALSLAFGWWGIPWGPIYTIGSLWTNLRGGVDVTDAVSADLATTHGAAAVPPLPGTPAAGRWNTGPLAAIGAFAAAIFAVVASLTFYAEQHRPVALANALDTAYVATIDGIPHTLRPHSVVKLELPAGPHTVAATVPGSAGPVTFTFEAGDATVVNPDGAALVAEETTLYTRSDKPAADNPKPALHCGHTAYALPSADCFLDEFPESVKMSKHARETTRRRIAVYADFPLDRTADIVEHHSGRAPMVAFLTAQGRRFPADEAVLDTVAARLKPPEAKAFFAAHLATRPVLVEWHRAYQNHLRNQGEGANLLAEYRRLAEAEPEEGALAYLHGRLLDDPLADTAWFERSLTAKRPCAHGHFALAYNAVARGDFSAALAGLDRARAAGLANVSARELRAECLQALDRPAEALQELRSAPGPRSDFARLAKETQLAFATGGRAAATQVVDAFIARLPAATRKESGGEIRKSFGARIAYFEGDAKAFAESIPADATGFAAVTRAICLREHAAAYRTLVQTSEEARDGLGQLLLYLSACATEEGDAELYWRFLVSTWGRAGGRHARLAAHFKGTAKLTDAEILDYPLNPAEKRLVLAAVGLHEPKLRAAAFARAKQCNFSLEFPHHLVAAALATAKP